MRRFLFIVLCCTTLIACSGKQQESNVVEDTVFQTVKDTIVAECSDTQQTIEADTPATIKNDIPNTKAKGEDIDISICTSEQIPYNDDSSYIDIDIWEEEEYTYLRVEKMPAYPGGMRELMKDIYENLVYPEAAKNDSIRGYVVVRFVVDKEGHITTPEILKFHHYAFIDSPAFDSAAIDVLSHLKPFEPGEHRGEKVNVYFDVPIQFRLDK